jgi:hypothetical protein
MSYQRDVFEIEVRFSQVKEYNVRDWVNGIDMLNALSMWEMLRTLAALTESKREEVVKAAEAILKQQRGWVKPYDRIAWAADIVTSNVFKSPPAGLFQIQPRMSQSSEEMDANVFLEEKKGGKKSEWITLGQPSIATNAVGISPRYHMQFTETIAAATSAQSIVDLVASKAPLKHWAISCHGFVNHDDGATRIALGQNLDHSNVGLFTKLKGKVDVIWIGGCFPASSDPGKEDCKARAQNAGCYLVAPAFLVASKTGADLPRGRIELNRRFMPVVFKPDGGLLGWDSFLAMGKTLNFTVS